MVRTARRGRGGRKSLPWSTYGCPGGPVERRRTMLVRTFPTFARCAEASAPSTSRAPMPQATVPSDGWAGAPLASSCCCSRHIRA